MSLEPTGGPLTLFTIPYGGGNTWSYRALEAQLLPEIAVVGLELPGRGRRADEPLLTSLEDLADDVFRQLNERIRVGRYALFGHSLGALLGLLAVRRIRRAGSPLPQALFASGCEAPSAQSRRQMHLLPHQEFVDMLRDMGGFPSEALQDPDLLEFFEPILRADFMAIETWAPAAEPALNLPLIVMIGDDDYVSEVSAQAWQRETTQSCRVVTFEGDHFFIFKHIPEIAAIVRNHFTG